MSKENKKNWTPDTPRPGKVKRCKKLYVRKGPGKQHEPVWTLNKDAEITVVNPDHPIKKDWYKVKVGDALEGFCMKEFIDLI